MNVIKLCFGLADSSFLQGNKLFKTTYVWGTSTSVRT